MASEIGVGDALIGAVRDEVALHAQFAGFNAEHSHVTDDPLRQRDVVSQGHSAVVAGGG